MLRVAQPSRPPRNQKGADDYAGVRVLSATTEFRAKPCLALFFENILIKLTLLEQKNRPNSFKSLKAELIWRQKWPTRRQAEAAIFQYINGFYNTRRRHSYLGGISPLTFEAKVA